MNLYEYLESSEQEVLNIINNKHLYYLTYRIKKRSGKLRRIDAPVGRLKQIQNNILYKFLYKFKAHPIAHGFVKDRNPKTNAMNHVGKSLLITMDIREFFNSIKENKVFDIVSYLLQENTPYTVTAISDAEIITQLLTYRGCLTQGAPTSPTFSNLVCLPMDKQLQNLEKIRNVTITRYADDIAISTSDIRYKDRLVRKSLIREISNIFYKNSFYTNTKKTKVRRKHQRMQVTGIVINEKPNIKRTDWRNFRARLHNLLKENLPLPPKELQQLRGYIEWVTSINQLRGNSFLSQYNKLLKIQ